ncbi:M20/M25/M40 family metallo-hydrolase [Sphingomicrobium clamense]|uniref:Carboxypeptidase Q n=1 Tax=Sphingomicrobium clamense TaxID=2851013 RepID=A0ABS6V5H0_9SPHN|nr:M20/M25/M40 family metallo-hydrolase [Sphingomicrobium sp. B8]MBW0144814.1 M20/M25/M40 family metallo-hydrolase [Sphingomicrobium sp. B8]
MKTFSIAAALALVLSAPANAQDRDIAKIIDQGLTQSRVMKTAHELVDRIGPRLTNSPGMRRAEAWAINHMRGLGLDDVRQEGFDFGRGWEMVDIEVDMLTPRPIELTAIATAWTPGTNGPVESEIVVAPMRGPEDFAAYRGKLNGKIVLITLPGTGDEPTRPAFRRWENSDFARMDEYRQPTYDPHAIDRRVTRISGPRAIDDFLASEGAVAVVKKSYRDGKLLHGSGYRHRVGDTPKLPHIEIAAEDYRRLARLAKTGDAPRLRIDSRVRWHDEDTNAYNIIGDIRGTDPNAGYVMAGAHFDSWAAGDGAVDNGSGSVVVLEAARILKTMTRPMRTIRFALWGAEEQGLHGSKAYIDRHLARRPIPAEATPDNERTYWGNGYPIEKLAGYDQMKAYFNMDNGSGRFRGIYADNNTAATSLLGKWLGKFRALDAHRVVIREAGGTDHVFMQDIGLPAFQFIQDPLDYGARLHHTNVDTLDHMRPEDLRQAAVVMAGMLWQAANSDETLPPEPLPQQPTVTDPFAYDYPDKD